jgi:hypothetical protein
MKFLEKLNKIEQIIIQFESQLDEEQSVLTGLKDIRKHFDKSKSMYTEHIHADGEDTMILITVSLFKRFEQEFQDWLELFTTAEEEGESSDSEGEDIEG